MSKNKTHIVFQILKFLGWILLTLCILIIAARFSLKTSLIHDIAKNQITSIANKNLNGTLTIGKIDGDLWKDFTIYEITIAQPDTLLKLDTLSIQYNIRGLLNKTFISPKTQVKGMEAFITETGENHFNFQELIIPDTSQTTPSFNFDISQLELRNSAVSVNSPSYLPDSALTIQSLNASSSIRFYDEISASLLSLSFQLSEGRLPGPIHFQSSAFFENQLVTLNQLVIETGRSFLSISGNTNLEDSTFNTTAEASPLSFFDLKPYLENDLPGEELRFTLKAGGNFDSLSLELHARGNGFEDLLVISDLSFNETPILRKFGISGRNLDLAYFTNNSVDAEVGEFMASIEGKLTPDISASDLTWGFTFSNIRYETYLFEILFGSGTFINENLIANIQLRHGDDEIIAYPEINHIFAEKPSWRLPIHFSNINPGWWLRNPDLTEKYSFRFLIEGQGFELTEEPWDFALFKPRLPRFQNRKPATVFGENPSLSVDTMIVANQKISDLSVKGSISADSLKAGGYVHFTENRISFTSAFSNYLNESASYNYKLWTTDFNLSEINGIDDFPTSINLLAEGKGQYLKLEKIQLNTKLLIDSSYVNGAAFDSLDITANLEQNILTIKNGKLLSEVMEGRFSGRQNLTDRTDPENDLALDVNIKNLQPVASLIGTNVFKATGRVQGNITQIEAGTLQFDGRLNLNDVYYDTLYSADSIVGNTRISIGEFYEFDFALDITQPVYSDYNLQDIKFSSNGEFTTDSVAGDFNLEIDSEDAGNIKQAGSYAANLKNLQTKLSWTAFDFQTPARLLSLQSPFNVTYQNSSIQTDTLRLRSDGGTFLNMAIPYADSASQEIWVHGRDFDFGIIQEIVFDERFVDGILSGVMEISKSPAKLFGEGSFGISNLHYKGTEIDILNLDFSILSERLTAHFNVTMDGEEKVAGNLDVPFIAADPSTFEDSFFDEPVSGNLVINPVQLSEFENVLNAFQITQTDGIISFDGELSGTVGEPDMEGMFTLEQPTLSGIIIDYAFARFNYHHLQKKITALAQVDARGQKAASINADLPISVDFRSFKINMPDESDSLSLNIVTNEFNISVFNDFLDKQYLSQLRGFLNANINISGTAGNLSPKGFLRLDAAEVSVPIAGIKLSKINSEFNFTETGLQLNRFQATSGSGNFNANGSIDLEGITPTNLDINARATRFRLANTPDYNLTIDLNSKLTGSPGQPVASGVLTVKNGFVYLQDFGEKSVESVELDDEESGTFSPYDSLGIDMRLVIERNFLVRNRRYLDLEFELAGELDAQKQADQELQLFGSLNARRGYVRPLGKQFTLDEGRFTFSGPLDKPDLLIRTSYIPQTTQKQGAPITLYYIIEGNAKDPVFRFESDPEMEQQNIVCYTLFNKPCYALESWQQVVSGSSGTSPTDLLVDVLLGELETLATQQLGIDVVQIENIRSGSNSGTSIKTGWYLNRRTFFAIINEISGSSPKTLFILEYLLTENLDLIITQGDDNRQGIDIRWQYDY